MAVIQMWPQNQGLRNSVSFNGRTYSSIPGISIPVPDFDAPVLQANGWTTYATIAGKNTITMLPPAGLTTISFDGRQYSSRPGLSIEVPLFDATILQANGWTIVAGALQPLTLSAAAFHVGDPQGTVVGTILGASSGSTIAFDSLSTAGALQIAGMSLQVGPTPSGAPATVTFNLVETLTGATNSPNRTNGFSVSELVAIPVNTVVPTITGTAQAGQTLTATNGTWTNSPTSFSYQWNRAGTLIGGATASTYVPVAADVGNTLTVTVVATNSGGSSAPATSAATSAVAAAGSVPVNMVLPTISGTAQVGQTLTATNGTWTNSPTSFTYHWNRAGTPIGGATASTYVPVAADVGNTLTVTVVATNSSGPSAPATSSATNSVIDIIPTINTAASIPGTPHVGSPITAIDAVWNHSVTSVAYQWQAAGINGTGAGATTLTYTPAAGDLGKTLTITVTATNSGGTSAPSTSAASAAVIAAGAVPALLPIATLFNAALSSTNNGWTGWQSRQVIAASNLANPGFTSGLIQVTFDLAAGSSGGTLAGAYVGNLGTSNAISFDGSQVPLTFGGSPTITGLGPGTFLSDAVPFTINMTAGLVISSLWGAGTTNALESQGTSTGNTVANSASILDQTATTPANYPSAWSVHANQSTFISNVTFSAAPFITGTAQVGQTLTASHGAWTNSPTSFTYQWNRAGTPIGGATASAYVPVTADVGNTLTVSVVAMNSGGSSAPATSAPTRTIVASGGSGVLDFSQAANSVLLTLLTA